MASSQLCRRTRIAWFDVRSWADVEVNVGNSRKHQRDAGPWIYNPWLDLIVGCGAWSAPLLLVSYLTLSSSARMWSVVFYALALFFNYPHYMATIYRAYHRAEDFEKYRIFTVHITALVVLTILLAHFWARLLPWIFTIYLTWSPWHYSGQNYGLFMMFARRAGANPGKSVRRALYGAFVVSYLVLFLGFHTGASSDPMFLSLGIPAIVSRWEQIGFGIAFVGLSVFGLSRLARETGWRKLIPSITLYSSQFLWFLFPTVISLIRGVEIPQSRYSTGVLAVMHSAQYLWITSYYARREAVGEVREKGKWRPLAYFGVLILGGIALFVPGPWLASRAFHHDFTASFLIFTALVNIHHFILDGAIWKLRDGRIAALLLNSRDRLSEAASEAGGRLVVAGRWLVGSAPTAHWLRVGAAIVLLAWGTVDQLRHYLSGHADDLQDLQRAAVLNAYDSPLQVRLARKEMADGYPDQAEGALQRAVQTNPGDAAARQALIRFYLDQKKLDNAYDLTEASLRLTPRDANLLVDRGLLELQRGHADKAIASWDQALVVDSSQFLPHLYMAQELDKEGEAQAAASHYEAFLKKIPQQKPQDRPAPELVAAIALRMADCQARSRQTEVAIKSYRLAEQLAVKTKQPKLESVANINEAELEAKTGKLDDALRLYQHALELDEASGDKSASVLDWLEYGRFLDQSGFPARLAYACVEKSQSVAQSLDTKTSLPDSADKTRQSIEARLGQNEAAAVRSNLDPVLHEALILRR
jgi:tetratricopeptide (TPR) repeat protein